MKKPGYYSSGEFGRMAHITLRTVRYYDKQNILQPSLTTPSGARFYTDKDFARLQQILLLKALGFSLKDIRQMVAGDFDVQAMLDSLTIQLKLVQDRMEQLQLVEHAIQDTAKAIRQEHTIDWSRMLKLIHLTGMEKSLTKQYQDASNISARINLHRLYSQNPKGWFSWIYEQAHISPSDHILEIGCGDGSLWSANLSRMPEKISIILSDISEGMLRDAKRSIGSEDPRFCFQAFDCHQIPFPDNTFDLVIANHLLFYCQDIPKACQEACRVLKPGGTFLCSAYGKLHMKEISRLVQEFNDRIMLSANKLYQRFGRENGSELLSPVFGPSQWLPYPDSLTVTEPEPLISYILSCHGNQNQYLLDSYQDFSAFVKKKTKKGFFITKDAGIFLCHKENPEKLQKN